MVLGIPGDTVDIIRARGGNDRVTAGRGDDIVRLGAGDDIFYWNTGDGMDSVNGHAGLDTAFFFGTGGGDRFFVAAPDSGDGVAVSTETEGALLKNVETIKLKPGEGQDMVAVESSNTPGVSKVIVDLSRSADKNPDGDLDLVTIGGTEDADEVTLLPAAGGLKVVGAETKVIVKNADVGVDVVQVKGLGGDDHIDASALPRSMPMLAVQAGEGNDTIIGGARKDYLNGGFDNDHIIGGRGGDFLIGDFGQDVLEGGHGKDKFVFASDDHADTIVDFSVAKDMILLDIDRFSTIGDVLNPWEFATGPAATSLLHRIIYNPATGELLYDRDGTGEAGAVAIAVLGENLALSFTDFRMVDTNDDGIFFP